MPVSMAALCEDLADESAELRTVLAGLSEAQWREDTPAAGWTIADQVSHLAYFDDVALRSATDPEAFDAEKAQMDAEGGVNPDTIAERFRDLTGSELLTWFDEARGRLITEFGKLDPSTRVPWFGPAMSAASSLTARIMETWAHAQDIYDTVGAAREPVGPAASRRAHRGRGAGVQLRRARQGPAHDAGAGGADRAGRVDVGLGSRRRHRPHHRSRPPLRPADHPAPPPRRPGADRRG